MPADMILNLQAAQNGVEQVDKKIYREIWSNHFVIRENFSVDTHVHVQEFFQKLRKQNTQIKPCSAENQFFVICKIWQNWNQVY